ncbi:sugar ABC transporter ATP-binding protein [Lichenihabitans psoromatis]|uniref:sugar ABC transporter ATP-binding protein n=1 Tax=Lichenihabitans psoromatis TaxID=2528642 RepID=UPI001036E707|nr:sugar ABC transporter ATP-binding protein [Lichenihabitans psoromatis]
MSNGDTPGPSEGLSIRRITKHYGPITVLRDVDLDVRPGEVVALLGENGAGKSTVSSVIAGLVPPTSGTMTWNGQPYAPTSPADALHQGIGLIHQEMRLLPDLSIAENVFVGRLPTKNGRVDRAGMARRAAENLRSLGLDVSPATLVRDLRVAAQQQVEIAKALTLNARFLIFDEPTAALGGGETDHLFAQIERLKRGGMGFIYISHRLDEIARIADRVVVLRDGQVVGNYATAQVPVKTLVEAMVGRSLERMFPTIEPLNGKEVLRVERLTSPAKTFTDVSFSVKAGEVFGVAGIVGAGRTELMRAIAGADPIASGTITVEGKPLAPKSPADSLAAGIVLVPEDRKAQGLVLEHTIGDNIALGNYPLVAPSGFVTPGAVRRFADENIRRFGIKGSAGQPANHLSGGNQQKVVLAKSIARRPKIVILDEPTRGIDVGARAQIYDVIAALAREGLAVIVVSSDLDEVLGLSHRVMVLSRGMNRGILDHTQANRISVMERATH